MDNLTRRRFLGWTTAGAAGLGVVSLARHLASGSASPASSPSLQPAPSMAEPLVAYVNNPAGGQISLMVGTQEVVLHDPDLVSRLFHRAAGR